MDDASLIKNPANGWFDGVADRYAKSRPRYPEAFFEWMAKQAPALNRCWDAACGNGQSSIGLTRWFKQVEATDLSAEQIARAEPHAQVNYRVEAAEEAQLPANSMDAVLVASAIHWLDVAKFNKQTERILRPQGLLVWMGYDPLQGAPAGIQHWLDDLYHKRLRERWPPQRIHVDRQFSDLPFPIPAQPLPHQFFIKVDWSLQNLINFINTWSALRRSEQMTDHVQQKPLIDTLKDELEELWPKNQPKIQFRLPMMGRWGAWPS